MKINPRSGKFSINLFGQVLPDQLNAVQHQTRAIIEGQEPDAPATPVADKLEEVVDSQSNELSVELLESSFEKIKPQAEEFVSSFYENLFTAHPELKPLLANSDMALQQKKLLNTLVLVVESRRNPEALRKLPKALGIRQVRHGAILKYYSPVVKALLLTFEQYLLQDWTPEVKQAWVDAFRAITGQMLKGTSANYSPKEAQAQTMSIPEKEVATAPATPVENNLEEIADSPHNELPIELLESSFEKIKPRAEEFVASFYENLFAAHPEVKLLFASTEMEKQQKKLLNSLVLVVENLRNPEALEPVLAALGARHVGYGAIPQYYSPVGEALLLTFEQYLQDDWTLEVKQAWATAFRGISQVMLKGAGVDYPAKDVQVETRAIPSQQMAPAPAIPAQHQIEQALDSQPKELPVELLQSSFEKLKPRANEFAASFYENLFAAHPEVKPLFANVDMALQQKKLLNSLVLVVESLRHPDALEEVLQALGARHVGYGAIPQYYGPVGKALLKTFEQYLQDDWTPEVKQAWTIAFRGISQAMLKGAGVEASPKSIRNEKEATLQKSSELKAEFLNESKPFPPQSEQLQKALASIQWNSESLKQIQDKITETYRQIQPQLTVEQAKEILKNIPGKIIDTFWTLPAWAVVLSTGVTVGGLFLLADDNSWLAKLLSDADAISLVLALVLFIKEAPDRKKQFHYQAWSIVDGAHGIKVSYARILALQDLNEDGVSLRELDAPSAKLDDINLPKANLSEANFSESDLSNANLSHANLNKANLSKAKLSSANLNHTNLSFACLSQANLSSANLGDANLICADLSNANLTGANLKNASLSGANLKGTYLMSANLKGAKVSAYDLSGALLEGAIMPDGSKYKSMEG